MVKGPKPSGIAVDNSPASTDTASVKIESDQVTLSLSTGESATILLHGATIISWKSSSGEDHLFLSPATPLDGSSAIRGGIPLLAQHGFARTSKWELLGKTSDSASHVQVDFGLGPANLTEEARAAWPHEFGLIYSVVLSKGSLETKILVRNEGKESVEFNVLFHTYLKVPDISTITLTGLQNTSYKDKVLAGATSTETSSALTITGETDRVYTRVPGPVTVQDGSKPIYSIERSNLEDIVVWNPWKEGAEKIKDFGPAEGYRNMVCVEAGSVARFQTLEAGSVWEGGQILSLL
ncbi:galactose mutarotase-like domain-containing protein [Peziza echinospora]|nr:galactose mutarotase-like domain-containing protein [Peziza echinospora]